uniref:Strictosidine synthase conserved region domain-containing protein n=1 Tax=Oryza punctata TaxID=4537 RepID=A0A0E0KJ26_ORYPU
MHSRRIPSVLHRNLQFPNGVSLSKDGSFFVFSDGNRGRLSRYWQKGEKAASGSFRYPCHGF